ncbi:Prohibitin-1, subunit of the prohibitin complex (Phb1p-Phb2p) [Geranomyces variabilis]|nr:band 7 family-domain-containing protein [Geranomyces variabilis]KAJ3131468.1 Prohibitin-1, subunit of the prohibitin complex (Phb1p-Phb2p) [Geranomyces variabilis]KAJ3144954.1 Prohibitin-1, subunit of the prohibitin complex (Phb1p-Phb2p) [Geranomyces variabilis]KAJ3166609.1 Prohibitin-1, subunit of the prohibitin complex (Phb1p-Phb2p) [Geranomyces variabilis]
MSTAALETLAKWAVPIGAIVSGVQSSMYTVGGGERAVIYDRVSGTLPIVKGEGTHFLIPWIQKPHIYDVRTKPRNISTTTGSRDMQMVSLTLRVLHRPVESRLWKLHKTYGKDYEEKSLPGIGNEVLKSVVAQFDASELITQRDLVSQRIREDLLKRADEFHLELEDVSITHLSFGKDFTDAVELKVIAQQEAERARFVVDKAEQEQLAAVIRAEGESQAANLLSNAYKKSGQAHLELRRIETSKEIATSLASARNVTYLPSSKGGNNGPSMLLNLGQ